MKTPIASRGGWPLVLATVMLLSTTVPALAQSGAQTSPGIPPAVSTNVLVTTGGIAPAPAPAPVPVRPELAPAPTMPPIDLQPQFHWIPLAGESAQTAIDRLPTAVVFEVRATGSRGGRGMALIDYGGASYIVEKGSRVPQDDPAMVVKNITADGVEVYDPVTQRIVRRSLSASTGGI